MPKESVLEDKASKKTGLSLKQIVTIKNVLVVFVTAVSLLGLYLLSTYSYLLFHSIVEVFSIVIAFAIFTIAWNTKRVIDNRYFLFIGIAFVFIATLDLFHMLAYNGMGIFAESYPGANLATQLWLATRYVLAFSLLIPLLLIRKNVKARIVIVGYTTVTLFLFASILVWQNFPTAYISNVGLTSFKIASEYAISIIILVAIGLLVKKRREFSEGIFKLLLASMAVAVATEMAFTLYSDVYGIMNMVGHLLNVVSFYLIYRALVQTNLTKPYDLLFRNLKQSETTLANRAEELTQLNERLEEEITERQAIEEALKESQERLSLKLDSVLSPDVELGEQDLANIIDVSSLQATMDHLYTVIGMGFALIDLKGKVLIGTGWQDICTKFHRVNPQTCKNCVESDIQLSSGLKRGEIRLYKCKNNMWDVVTPLFIGDNHVGNVFFGQFFFDDEVPDRELFVAQAKQYGFDTEEYLLAFERIPRFNRKSIQELMVFYARLSELVSKISHANLKLAKNLNLQKDLQEKLEGKAAEVEEYASQMEQLADERARKLKDAERLSAIGATAGMVGHDIRNPLQAIISELYLAQTEIEAMPNNAAKHNMQESIQSIEENVQYINKIIADLQDFAKPLNPRKEQVNLSKAITDALAIVVVPKNIEVTINSDEKIAALTADSTMMKRILVNLTQNAVQAMPKGGKLTITTTNKRQGIEIAIQDTGEGIPQEVQPKLFTPLMTTKSKGQGFGLAVVKRMTEAMGGTVSFESELGKGTTFTLKFPG